MTTGGGQIGDKGYFVQPTVFADVTDNMAIANEEVWDILILLISSLMIMKCTFILWCILVQFYVSFI